VPAGGGFLQKKKRFLREDQQAKRNKPKKKAKCTPWIKNNYGQTGGETAEFNCSKALWGISVKGTRVSCKHILIQNQPPQQDYKRKSTQPQLKKRPSNSEKPKRKVPSKKREGGAISNLGKHRHQKLRTCEKV